MPKEVETTPCAFVSISQMARLIGLSRSRFHQLLKEGVFPQPANSKDSNGRRYYDEDAQAICLRVRRSHVGINGKPILFYAKRCAGSINKSQPKRAKTPRRASEPPTTAPSDDLLDGLRQLGLGAVSPSRLSAALEVCCPPGTDRPPHDEILVRVFRYLSSQNSGGNHGR